MASTPPSHDQTAAGAIGILIPVFNDWTQKTGKLIKKGKFAGRPYKHFGVVVRRKGE